MNCARPDSRTQSLPAPLLYLLCKNSTRFEDKMNFGLGHVIFFN